MRLALGIGVLMVVILTLTACGGGSSEEEANKPRPLPEDATALSPGEYHSVKFEPSFSFHVGKGWSTLAPETSDALALSTQGETRWVGFTNVQEIYNPTAKGTQKVVEAPEDMVGWFQHHPYLQTDEPESITVGGVKGEQFDLVVDAPENYYGQCGSGDCMDIYRLSDGETISFEEGNKTRIVVLEDVKGDTVVLDIGTSATEFDEFMPEAQKVLDTVKWGGS
jgi:hypothetical protein